LQETWRKRRQHQSWDIIGRVAATAVAHVVGCVEPMEVNPPEDEEEPMEVDPPPAWLTWHHYTVPGLPSMAAALQQLPTSILPSAQPQCPALAERPILCAWPSCGLARSISWHQQSFC